MEGEGGRERDYAIDTPCMQSKLIPSDCIYEDTRSGTVSLFPAMASSTAVSEQCQHTVYEYSIFLLLVSCCSIVVLQLPLVGGWKGITDCRYCGLEKKWDCPLDNWC